MSDIRDDIFSPDDYLALVVKVELRSPEALGYAAVNYVQCTCSETLDVAAQINRVGEKRIYRV